MSATGGSVQLVEGSGITLTTTGTSADGIITIASSGGGGGSTFADNVFEIYDNTDNTKKLAFEASGITTGTTRTLTIPNASGTIALTSDLASYVPYTGATTSVNLGANNLTATAGTFSGAFAVGTNAIYRVAGSSKVSFGTTTQNYQFTLYATGNDNRLHFLNNTTGTAVTDGTFMGLDDGVNFSFWQRENGYIRFGTNETERLRITGAGLLTFAGVTSAFPALKRDNTELQVRLADDSGFTSIQALGGTFNGNTYIKALGVNQTLTGNFSGVTFAVNTGSMSFAMSGTTFGFYNTSASDLADGQIRTSGLAISNILFGTPNASAILDVASTTKGFLPPRMTTTQKNNIATPTAGLIIYDTTLNKLCVYTTAWQTITSA